MKRRSASNFALIGAAGYVAPRHLRAIRDTGNLLIAGTDPHDSVGVLDRFFPEARFFKEIERFDRFLEKLRRESEEDRVQYMSICSPNFLHDAHVRLALRVWANAICEKPLVISPWNLDAIQELEAESEASVYTVLQLRLHPGVRALKRRLEASSARRRADVCLTYVTRRGPWYHVSWKGSQEKSGGLAMNIGVHFFDLLLWMFGPMERSYVHIADPDRMSGVLDLAWARVRWFLSINGSDLPDGRMRKAGQAYRSMTVDGEPLDLSKIAEDLHTKAYEEILAGRGFGVEEARPSIELVHAIGSSEVQQCGSDHHPFLTGSGSHTRG